LSAVTEFFNALTEPQNAFLRYALLTGLLVSVACGVMGSYVVTKRITYIAGSIAHCVLGGMGAAQYARTVFGWQWCHPIQGAVVSALAAALIIGWVSLRAKQREDTIIGAVWAIGMAAGILFIAKTPGYSQDLMSYLFGNILMVRPNDLWLLLALDVLLIVTVVLVYNQFLAVCFDEEFARLRGLPVDAFYLLLLCLIALAVVLLVTVVGIILVIALLTLPAAIAGQFARKFWHMMVLAVLLSLVFTTSGVALSYKPDLPAGATTIILAGLAYVAVIAITSLTSRRRG